MNNGNYDTGSSKPDSGSGPDKPKPLRRGFPGAVPPQTQDFPPGEDRGHHLPPPQAGHPPHPPKPPFVQDEKLRARFELDSAYRDLRRGELLVQQIETYIPECQEALFARQLLDTAASVYQTAYKSFQNESYYRAAEFSVAVKDILRGIDKFYHTAGPYPIYPDAEKNNTIGE